MIRNFRELKATIAKVIRRANASKAAGSPIRTLPAPPPKKRVSDATSRKRYGRFIDAARWKAVGGMRRHCSKCGTRFKRERFRVTIEDEGSGISHSLKAKTTGCPKCVRADRVKPTPNLAKYGLRRKPYKAKPWALHEGLHWRRAMPVHKADRRRRAKAIAKGRRPKGLFGFLRERFA